MVFDALESSFEPVVVKANGEAIRPNSEFPYTDEHEFDRHNKHEYCDGAVHIRRVTKSLKALHCVDCGLRRYFPVSIKTYGELRKYFEGINKKKNAVSVRRRSKSRAARITASRKRAKVRRKSAA